MESFSINVIRCAMCPWNKECEWADVSQSSLPSECPSLVASNLRHELLEALKGRDCAVNFMIRYGSPESRKAIGFTDEGWTKKRDLAREGQRNLDHSLAQMDSLNIGIERHIRDAVKDWYSERIEELEEEWERS